MHVWQISGSVSLALALGLAGGLSVAAQESVEDVDKWASGQVDETEQTTTPPVLREAAIASTTPIPSTHPPIYPHTHPSPALTLSDWVAQIEASLTQITGVRVEETETGLQLVLETAEGNLPTPTTQTVGNALIADIPNAVLVLPDGNSFEQFAPAEGIALVAVTNEPGNRVRVAITGTDATPVVAVTATGLAVMLGEAVVEAEDDAIQVVVTGEQDEGYNPSSASVGTRTDTPLRDIPQSIQVVPRQVLEDQQTDTLREALRNVPGVVQGSISQRVPLDIVLIRGFSTTGNTLRNGLPDFTSRVLSFDTAIVDQVEVLRGPASVLYGQGSPRGYHQLHHQTAPQSAFL